MIIGDFNYKEIDYENYVVKADVTSEAYKFFTTTQDQYLIQNVTEETRKREGTSASVLDYIFTDEEMLVEKLDYDTPLGKSDHVCLTWSYIIKVTENQQMPNTSMLNY